MKHCLWKSAAILAVTVAANFAISTDALAQANRGFQNLTIQLPTRTVFSVRTVVSVPDGGTISLAGGGTNAYFRDSGGRPGAFPRSPFSLRNRNSSVANSAGGVSVSARVLSLRELEQDALRKANQKAANQKADLFAKSKRDFDPPPAVARKANFLARNIGRTKK